MYDRISQFFTIFEPIQLALKHTLANGIQNYFRKETTRNNH
jgi:hypothetical protein